MSLGVAPCEELVNKHRKPSPLDSSKPLRDWAQTPISRFTHSILILCKYERRRWTTSPPHLWETVLYSNVVEMLSHSPQRYSAGKQRKSPSRTSHSAPQKASALGTGGSSSLQHGPCSPAGSPLSSPPPQSSWSFLSLSSYSSAPSPSLPYPLLLLLAFPLAYAQAIQA